VTALRVLIIDDNPLNVELAEFLLTADGFEVDTAADAPAALELLARHRPDVILMDVQLPGQDGLALTRRLKGDPATRGIAVIAFTAYAMKGDEAKMLAAGCDGYLSKPIDVSSFAASVRGHLPR
jgi:CheY-like chemotaxis protein